MAICTSAIVGTRYELLVLDIAIVLDWIGEVLLPPVLTIMVGSESTRVVNFGVVCGELDGDIRVGFVRLGVIVEIGACLVGVGGKPTLSDCGDSCE